MSTKNNYNRTMTRKFGSLGAKYKVIRGSTRLYMISMMQYIIQYVSIESLFYTIQSTIIVTQMILITMKHHNNYDAFDTSKK